MEDIKEPGEYKTLWTHRCLIMTADNVGVVRDLCERLAGPPGSGMFKKGLSSSGNEPATHYISTGMISHEFAALVSDANLMFQACQAAGLSITQEKCNEIISVADVSDEKNFSALDRLLLVLIENNDNIA